jgi:hypothetical protein
MGEGIPITQTCAIGMLSLYPLLPSDSASLRLFYLLQGSGPLPSLGLATSYGGRFLVAEPYLQRCLSSRVSLGEVLDLWLETILFHNCVYFVRVCLTAGVEVSDVCFERWMGYQVDAWNGEPGLL